MAEFACKVGDSTGKVFVHVEAAATETEVRQRLSERGYYVYSVRSQLGLLSSLQSMRRSRVIAGNDFLIFNQQFNTLIKAGLPILKALDLLTERAASARLRPVLADVRQKVREGALLSDAFVATAMFPKVYTTCLLAGEKSGNLAGVLDDYIAYQRVTSGAKRKLITVLIYPVILILFASAVVGYLVANVIPQFAQLYKDLNVELPPATRMLITIVVGYRGWIAGTAITLVIAALLLFVWSRTDRGGLNVDRLKLKLPVIGQTWIKFQVAQFVRTMATLLAGGTPLVVALETSAESMTSRLISTSASSAAQRVREGESLHAALASTGVVPDLALEMVEVGEASGALQPMLGSVAQFYEEDVNLRLGALLAVVEPAILICVALLIGFILIALYLPMFSLGVGAGAGAAGAGG